MKVFSPTQTRAWGFCPVYWQLTQQERWHPRKLTKQTHFPKIAGAAFARGMRAYRENTPNAAKLAVVNLSNQFESLKDAGFIFDEDDMTALAVKVARAVNETIRYDPFPSTLEILDIELTLPEAGHCRLDVGAKDTQTNSLVIVDDKLKLHLLAKDYDRHVQRFKHDHAMFHYAWAYGQAKGQPVERYGIHLVVLEPVFSAKIHWFSINPAEMNFWLATTRPKWGTMELHENGADLWSNPDHANQYGPCPMLDACFLYGLDEKAMQTGYAQWPKRSENGTSET